MSAVKLDVDGNIVESVEFDNVDAHMSPGFLAQLKEAAREGWREGKTRNLDFEIKMLTERNHRWRQYTQMRESRVTNRISALGPSQCIRLGYRSGHGCGC